MSRDDELYTVSIEHIGNCQWPQKTMRASCELHEAIAEAISSEDGASYHVWESLARIVTSCAFENTEIKSESDNWPSSLKFFTAAQEFLKEIDIKRAYYQHGTYARQK